MTLLRDVSVCLASDVYLAHIKDVGEDGVRDEFVSTCVRDLKGHVHGITVETDEWNRWHAHSALDNINFSATLLLPEVTDVGYKDVVVHRLRTGEEYASGEVVAKEFLSVVASPFPADRLVTSEEMPVWSPGSRPFQLLGYMSEDEKATFAELLATYPGGYRRYCVQRTLTKNRGLMETRPLDPVDEWFEDLRNEEDRLKAEAQWERALERENESWWRSW